jgi:hypothetical protein
MLYSARDYFVNAWHTFTQRQINIDVPIAVGLLALFFRSAYDILTHTGPGYMDSLVGLVFFLLIGRWFQNKTYDSLAFDRDYKSYFPLAVMKWSGSGWVPVIVHDLQVGDQIRIRNLEIIPADSTMLSEKAFIDYSFVTGESKPVQVKLGDTVYAGGRLVGQPIELSVAKITSQSHLTRLWNNQIFQKPEESHYKKIIDRAARRFTWVVMGVAVVTAVVWYYLDPSQMWLVLTAVLMVACPCALALAAPFTYGNMLRVFGRHGFYLKNADVLTVLSRHHGGVVAAYAGDDGGVQTSVQTGEMTPGAYFKGTLRDRQDRQDTTEQDKQDNTHNLQSAKPTPPLVSVWNTTVKSLPQIKAWTKDRERRAKKSLAELTGEEWKDICERVEASEFLSGRSGKWTACCFDWVIKPANLTKIMEGTYDNPKNLRSMPSEYGGWEHIDGVS